MHVAFDDQIFRAQTRGGVSRYIVELLGRLPEFGVTPIAEIGPTRNQHALDAGLAQALRTSRAREKLDWLSWRAIGRPRSDLPKTDFDVVHHTFTHPAYLGRTEAPSVVTVHDMTPEIMPERFPLGNPHFAKRLYAERATRIIAVSRSTADDMIRLYGEHLRDKTTVVPLGVSDHFFRHPVDVGLDTPSRYGLFVGVRGGYKRFDLALEVMARLMANDRDLYFVVAGGGALTDSERRAIDDAGSSERVVTMTPSDGQMPSLYRRAGFLLFPSEYEGFGLPTLESLAAGTPVVLADASCSREVGGTASVYFPPSDVDAATELARLSLLPEERDRVAVEGPEHARRFRWERTAEQTALVYASAVASGPASS